MQSASRVHPRPQATRVRLTRVLVKRRTTEATLEDTNGRHDEARANLDERWWLSLALLGRLASLALASLASPSYLLRSLLGSCKCRCSRIRLGR